ncbi:unnamed protein product [Amoebophrya sp. A25]|nr:unnamed protein product [Amoebophrya sp. A25]|eukprot:GSA25T00011312001.1
MQESNGGSGTRRARRPLQDLSTSTANHQNLQIDVGQPHQQHRNQQVGGANKYVNKSSYSTSALCYAHTQGNRNTTSTQRSDAHALNAADCRPSAASSSFLRVPGFTQVAQTSGQHGVAEPLVLPPLGSATSGSLVAGCGSGSTPSWGAGGRTTTTFNSGAPIVPTQNILVSSAPGGFFQEQQSRAAATSSNIINVDCDSVVEQDEFDEEVDDQGRKLRPEMKYLLKRVQKLADERQLQDKAGDVVAVDRPTSTEVPHLDQSEVFVGNSTDAQSRLLGLAQSQQDIIGTLRMIDEHQESGDVTSKSSALNYTFGGRDANETIVEGGQQVSSTFGSSIAVDTLGLGGSSRSVNNDLFTAQNSTAGGFYLSAIEGAFDEDGTSSLQSSSLLMTEMTAEDANASTVFASRHSDDASSVLLPPLVEDSNIAAGSLDQMAGDIRGESNLGIGSSDNNMKVVYEDGSFAVKEPEGVSDPARWALNDDGLNEGTEGDHGHQERALQTDDVGNLEDVIEDEEGDDEIFNAIEAEQLKASQEAAREKPCLRQLLHAPPPAGNFEWHENPETGRLELTWRCLKQQEMDATVEQDAEDHDSSAQSESAPLPVKGLTRVQGRSQTAENGSDEGTNLVQVGRRESGSRASMWFRNNLPLLPEEIVSFTQGRISARLADTSSRRVSSATINRSLEADAQRRQLTSAPPPWPERSDEDPIPDRPLLPAMEGITDAANNARRLPIGGLRPSSLSVASRSLRQTLQTRRMPALPPEQNVVQLHDAPPSAIARIGGQSRRVTTPADPFLRLIRPRPDIRRELRRIPPPARFVTQLRHQIPATGTCCHEVRYTLAPDLMVSDVIHEKSDSVVLQRTLRKKRTDGTRVETECAAKFLLRSIPLEEHGITTTSRGAAGTSGVARLSVTETFRCVMWSHERTSDADRCALDAVEEELRSPVSDRSKELFRGKKWKAVTSKQLADRNRVAVLAMEKKREWCEQRRGLRAGLRADLYGNRRITQDQETGRTELEHSRTRMINLDNIFQRNLSLRADKSDDLGRDILVSSREMLPDPFADFVTLCTRAADTTGAEAEAGHEAGKTAGVNTNKIKAKVNCTSFSSSKAAASTSSRGHKGEGNIPIAKWNRSKKEIVDSSQRLMEAAQGDSLPEILMFENIELLQEHDCLLSAQQQAKLKLGRPEGFMVRVCAKLAGYCQNVKKRQAETSGVDDQGEARVNGKGNLPSEQSLRDSEDSISAAARSKRMRRSTSGERKSSVAIAENDHTSVFSTVTNHTTAREQETAETSLKNHDDLKSGLPMRTTSNVSTTISGVGSFDRQISGRSSMVTSADASSPCSVGDLEQILSRKSSSEVSMGGQDGSEQASGSESIEGADSSLGVANPARIDANRAQKEGGQEKKQFLPGVPTLLEPHRGIRDMLSQREQRPRQLSRFLQEHALRVPSFYTYSNDDVLLFLDTLESMDASNAQFQTLLPNDFLVAHHSYLRAPQRFTLVDWLCEVCRAFKHSTVCFELAVNIMDQYCAKIPYPGIELKYYQIVGSVCLFLAVKTTELSPLTLDELTRLCDNQYNHQDFLDWEVDVVNMMNFLLLRYPSCTEYGGIFITVWVSLALEVGVTNTRDGNSNASAITAAGAATSTTGQPSKETSNNTRRDTKYDTTTSIRGSSASSRRPFDGKGVAGTTGGARDTPGRQLTALEFLEYDNVAFDPWWLFHARYHNGLLYTFFTLFIELGLHYNEMIDFAPKKRAAAALYCALCLLLRAECDRRKQLRFADQKGKGKKRSSSTQWHSQHQGGDQEYSEITPESLSGGVVWTWELVQITGFWARDLVEEIVLNRVLLERHDKNSLKGKSLWRKFERIANYMRPEWIE